MSDTNDQKLKMINRLLSIISGIERPDNKRLAPSEEVIYKCWTYIQIVKPMVILDSQKKGMTNSKLCVKYGITFCQVSRILREDQVNQLAVNNPAWENH